MIIPFAVGFGCARYFPSAFGAEPASPPLIFALFVGTALAISALPVIVKTLLDLNIYKSDFGMLVVSVAVIDDLAGWMLFAVILGMMGSQSEGILSVQATIGATLAFAVVLLTVGRSVINRLLPRVQAYTSWPGGILSFAVIGALFCAAFTTWIGIHAIFGAFLFGVALGDSRHLREKTRHTLENFIAFIFAPLFFASVGLKVDFARNFDPLLVLAVIAIACIGKILGCGLAGRLSGYSWRESCHRSG
jgi:Kef-type K+ transport system membrane component KefB